MYKILRSSRSLITLFLISSAIISSLLFLYYLRTGPTNRDKFFKYEYKNPYNDPELLFNPHQKNYSRVNACIVVLARNSELYQLKFSMRQFEERWNKKYNYPYVFLNDVEFSEEFKKHTSALTQSETKYGKF